MAIQNRYEFIYYVACSNCNPNGDPDMGNTPRIGAVDKVSQQPSRYVIMRKTT